MSRNDTLSISNIHPTPATPERGSSSPPMMANSFARCALSRKNFTNPQPSQGRPLTLTLHLTQIIAPGECAKTYEATVHGEASPEQLLRLSRGVRLDGRLCQFQSVRVLSSSTSTGLQHRIALMSG